MIHKLKIRPLFILNIEVEASSPKEAQKIMREVLELEQAKVQARWQKIVRDYGTGKTG